MASLQVVGMLLAASLAIWAAVITGWKLGVRYWSSR
jgi:hypothetical protein